MTLKPHRVPRFVIALARLWFRSRRCGKVIPEAPESNGTFLRSLKAPTASFGTNSMQKRCAVKVCPIRNSLQKRFAIDFQSFGGSSRRQSTRTYLRPDPSTYLSIKRYLGLREDAM